jgi:hypothetical protein
MRRPSEYARVPAAWAARMIATASSCTNSIASVPAANAAGQRGACWSSTSERISPENTAPAAVRASL